MEHSFDGTPFTVGIEEELMLVDPETLELRQGIETIIADLGPDYEDRVKPELMQSVLEIATAPHATVADAADELRRLRRTVRDAAERNSMLVAASGTHPSALWEEQLLVDRPRYKELAGELGYIARRELIFGTHVHVGVSGADRAIYISDGLRKHMPLLLALSANSPMWRGKVTGMMSARTPVFRAFPRVGIPPHYGTWEIYSGRVELMVEAGAIPDYTFLWFDVRPHPNLGTVEVRVFDQQTRLESTVALAAMVVALVHRYSTLFDEGAALVEVPSELIDDNKVRASLRGMEGSLIDFPKPEQCPSTQMASSLLEELEEHAQQVGCAAEMEGVNALIEGGTGAHRQLEVLEESGDVKTLVRELCEATHTDRPG